MDQDDNPYQEHWNYYVENAPTDGERWPGDEWGSPALWDQVYRTRLLQHGVGTWERCVEIGPGSGKYSLRVLRGNPSVKILAADVSTEFQRVFLTRMGTEGYSDRVIPILLDNNSGTLRKAVEAQDWRGKLDGFYSIDAMVHVDLQYLVAYLVTAAVCLHVNGTLIMSLANCCSDRGFEKLIKDTPQMFRRLGHPTAKFEWLSPDAVGSILGRLGFSITVMDTQSRDIWVVAKLKKVLWEPSILRCIH
jgi:hypothetical protein